MDSVFSSYAASSAPVRGWMTRRQDGPPICASAAPQHGSVSSFAYQGTNSHAVVEAPPGGASLARPQASLWQRGRLWYAATSHPLLQRFGRGPGGAGDVRVRCSLRAAALAYLWDHQVQGRAVAPAPALLELASAAAQLLWSTERTHNPAAVAAAALHQPLLLEQGDTTAPVLACTISAPSGDVSITSNAEARCLQAFIHALDDPAGASATSSHAPSLDAAAAPATASPHPALATLLLGTTLLASSPPAVVASVLATQRMCDAGYWAHPAVADAPMQLAAAAQVEEADAEQALAAVAVEVYAPCSRIVAASEAGRAFGSGVAATALVDPALGVTAATLGGSGTTAQLHMSGVALAAVDAGLTPMASSFDVSWQRVQPGKTTPR